MRTATVLGHLVKNTLAPAARRTFPQRGCYGLDGDLVRSTRVLADVARGSAPWPGRVEGAYVVELGPGRTTHLLAAMALLGARQATGLEVYEQVSTISGPADTQALGQVLLGMTDEARAIQEHFGPVGQDALKERMAQPTNVDFETYDGANLPMPDGSVDFLYSKSVLEHVASQDVGRLVKEFARVLRPGGFVVHIIDLRDHLYINGGDDEVTGYWLTALTYPDALFERMFSKRSSYINRLRASEWRACFTDAGLTIESWIERRYPLPVVDRSALQPRWASLPQSELEIGFLTVGARYSEAVA